MKAQVLTPWIGDGLSIETANRPKLADDYQLDKCVDITGQPSEHLTPDPNLLLVEIEAPEGTIDAIEADDRYQVLWSE